jgi:hypothetical protein
VIINDETAGSIHLPPLKMNNVDAAQLFNALNIASRKAEVFPRFPNVYAQGVASYGFQTDGSPTDEKNFLIRY